MNDLANLLRSAITEARAAQGVPLSGFGEAHLVMRLSSLLRCKENKYTSDRATFAECLIVAGRQRGRQAFEAFATIGDISLVVAASPGWQAHYGWRRAGRVLPASYFVDTGIAAYRQIASERPYDEFAHAFPRMVRVVAQAFETLGMRGCDSRQGADLYGATGDPFFLIQSTEAKSGLVM